ncbi:MAG TPA: outer membrane protein transport protein [Rhodocyclaceae bacterium]|nr:outer membrane protein transport protein [Rhodocyclaceae bacterium]
MTSRRISTKPLGTVLIGAAAALALPQAAEATNGYFAHGYGLKNKGMAGASTTNTHDAFGGANNPATMVWAGNRLDVGLDWFSPQRKAERSGSAPGGAFDFSVESDSTNFLIPEVGYNHMISPTLSAGVTVYGNGGMNTDYKGGQINCGAGPANALCGGGELGVDLMQLVVAPTLAWKFHERHSIGVSPLIGFQRFKAKGLSGFAPQSSSPNDVTNRGYDTANGWGVRVGYLGRLTDRISFGAAYSSKIDMSKFDKYKGLFAEQGDFDIPENWNVGLGFDLTPQLSVALDYQRINYSDVKSVGNPSTNQSPLGSNGGPGFGWRDINVYKLGVQWKQSEKLTLRAGYNHGDNPIRSRDVTFNIVAPGLIDDNVTAGATWTLDSGSEVTVAYMHAFKKSVTGTSIMPFGGSEKIQMYQDSLGIAYGMRF